MWGHEDAQDHDLILREEGSSGEDVELLPSITTSRPFWKQAARLGLLPIGIVAVVILGAKQLSERTATPTASVTDVSAAYEAYPALQGQPAVSQYQYEQAGMYQQQQPAMSPGYAAGAYQATAAYGAGGTAYGAVPAAATPVLATETIAQAAPAAVAFPVAAAAPAGLPAATGGECVSPGDDCTGPQCCKDPGFQCYTKDPAASYSTCRAVCEEGMVEKDGEPWSCKKLGEPAPVPKGPEQCAWSGENCIALKCCNDANMKCFQKDGYFAGCKFKPEDGWDNSILGEFRGWHQIMEPAPDGAPLAGTKLYCIAVQSPNKRVVESELLQSAAEKKIGIYSCDENSVFDGAEAKETAWKSIGNTDIFIDVWNQVKAEGKFWNNDWTVKADPDAVFFANRLKDHLGGLNIPKDEPVYVKNCDFKFRFQGSLEIFSEKAMELYMEHAQMCSDNIGHEGGEDFYMMTCMDAMGVKTVEDDSILYDKYATGEHLILDDVSSCSNGWTAAFHPFRDLKTWNKCAEAAQQAEQDFAGNPEE